MTGKAIAHHMQAIFAKYGWPNTLVTDNGPCYTSKEFQMLMESMYVNHITSSPHYPQRNGLVKKFVGIIKNLFHKAKEEGQHPYNSPNSLQKHTPQWKFTVTHANSTR